MYHLSLNSKQSSSILVKVTKCLLGAPAQLSSGCEIPHRHKPMIHPWWWWKIPKNGWFWRSETRKPPYLMVWPHFPHKKYGSTVPPTPGCLDPFSSDLKSWKDLLNTCRFGRLCCDDLMGKASVWETPWHPNWSQSPCCIMSCGSTCLVESGKRNYSKLFFVSITFKAINHVFFFAVSLGPSFNAPHFWTQQSRVPFHLHLTNKCLEGMF